MVTSPYTVFRAQVKMALVTSGQYVGTIGVPRAAQLGPDHGQNMEELN
jgi:hypothetical protein